MAYLDHAATTPVRPEARDAMLPWLGARTGNPSGAHRLAREARRALDDSRDVFAALTGFDPGDICFTAGGSEADNLAITGVVMASGGVPVCAATEHHAVLEVVEHLGGRVVPVDRRGRVDLDRFVAALDESVSVVSVMLVNNEVGTVQPLGPLIELVRRHAPRARFHTDAVQALSWLDLTVAAAGVDLLSLSAHKFGGPQGVGLLAVGPGVALRPLILGGGQERGRRSGTQNVAGIVGAAAAATATAAGRRQEVARLAALRDRLLDGILAAVPDAVETVPGPPRDHVSAGHAHVCFPGVESEALLVLLEDHDVYASAASSCSSGAQDPSHVLAAMGVPRSAAFGSLRLSLGWSTTDADIDAALAAVPAAVERLRSHSRPSVVDGVGSRP